jgi:hypothetical protein
LLSQNFNHYGINPVYQGRGNVSKENKCATKIFEDFDLEFLDVELEVEKVPI